MNGHAYAHDHHHHSLILMTKYQRKRIVQYILSFTDEYNNNTIQPIPHNQPTLHICNTLIDDFGLVIIIIVIILIV